MTAILKHQHIVWRKSYLDILNRLGVDHWCDGRRTDGTAIAIAASNTLDTREKSQLLGLSIGPGSLLAILSCVKNTQVFH